MEEQTYLDNYETSLTKELVKLCTGWGRLDGQLLASQDLDEKWESIAQSYLPDGIREIARYPTVSLGWMMYVGLAAAHCWDQDWTVYGGLPNLYEYLRDKRGFDWMDEYISEEVLDLEGEANDRMAELVRECATLALTQIRHEQVEPQSPMAFHIYVRSIHALYLTGISVELKRQGYHFEPA